MQSRLGRYVVLKHLASGGMADVLLGRTDGLEGFERHVVLKRIRADHAKDQRFIRMFLDEARLAATLHHQHVVQVHDVGESDGEYFIAMEYLHGEDVRTVLSTASKRRAHVPLGHAIAIVSAAAAGLHYAHERRGSDGRPLGIVHRDVSPSNILVGYDGSIKIVDFGIAKAAIREETRSGALKGKVSYMSPEQCTGAPIDRRSDVYALGVVLYELATTTRLFKGESDYRLMEQIVKGQVTLPRARRPDLPEDLSAIIMRALAPDPERRYFTADELRVALERFAVTAGLTASTSAIAAYMRKQFGDRPEPWLELGAQFQDSFDDDSPGSTALPRASWTELPRSQEIFRASSSSIPMRTAPILRAQEAAPGGPTDEARARQLVAPEPATPPATSSSMTYSPRPAAASARRFTPAWVAAVSAPLFLLGGIALWQLAGSRAPDVPAAPVAAPVVAQAAPAAAAAPVVPPTPEPAPPAAAPMMAARMTHATAPEPAAAPRSRPTPAAAAVTAPPKRAASDRSADDTAVAARASAEPTRTPRSEPPVKVARVEPPSPPPTRSATAPSAPAGAAPSPGSAAAASPVVLGPRPPLVASVTAPAPTAGRGSAAGSNPVAPPAVASTPPAAAAPAVAVAPVVTAAPSVAAPAAVVPAAPAAPQTVAQNVLDANRISGDKSIAPDDATQADIRRAGVDKVIGAYKLCIASDGSVDSITQIKSTGFPGYDQKIQSTIRSRWRYRPFLVAGKATAVCTAVRFIYSRG